MAVITVIGIVTPPMAWADRIWDKDLKRYLTEQEMTHAEIFLTEEEALKIMFPKSERVRKEIITLPPSKKQHIEDRIGWKFPEQSFEIYVGESGAQIDGYAVVQNTIGKHKTDDIHSGGGSPGPNLRCRAVSIPGVSRQRNTSEKRFNSQYEGKTPVDPVSINKDIINISGATMSVRSMSAGVKRVLILIDEFFLKPNGRGSDVMSAGRSDKGFWGTFFGN